MGEMACIDGERKNEDKQRQGKYSSQKFDIEALNTLQNYRRQPHLRSRSLNDVRRESKREAVPAVIQTRHQLLPASRTPCPFRLPLGETEDRLSRRDSTRRSESRSERRSKSTSETQSSKPVIPALRLDKISSACDAGSSFDDAVTQPNFDQSRRGLHEGLCQRDGEQIEVTNLRRCKSLIFHPGIDYRSGIRNTAVSSNHIENGTKEATSAHEQAYQAWIDFALAAGWIERYSGLACDDKAVARAVDRAEKGNEKDGLKVRYGKEDESRGVKILLSARINPKADHVSRLVEHSCALPNLVMTSNPMKNEACKPLLHTLSQLKAFWKKDCVHLCRVEIAKATSSLSAIELQKNQRRFFAFEHADRLYCFRRTPFTCHGVKHVLYGLVDNLVRSANQTLLDEGDDTDGADCFLPWNAVIFVKARSRRKVLERRAFLTQYLYRHNIECERERPENGIPRREPVVMWRAIEAEETDCIEDLTERRAKETTKTSLPFGIVHVVQTRRRQLSEKITVENVSHICVGLSRVSRVSQALRNGKFAEAATLLQPLWRLCPNEALRKRLQNQLTKATAKTAALAELRIDASAMIEELNLGSWRSQVWPEPS